MAILDFPNTPAVGDTFGSSGVVWRWDGAAWSSTAGASGARGVVGYAQVTASQGSITTLTDLTGLSATWTADPSRRYQITVQTLPQSNTANDGVSLLIATGGGGGTQVARQDSGTMPLANSPVGLATMVVLTGLSGSVTYRAQMTRSQGSGAILNSATVSIPSFILVEDITYEAGSAAGQTYGPVVCTARSTTAAVWGAWQKLTFSGFQYISDSSYFSLSGGNVVMNIPGVYEVSVTVQGFAGTQIVIGHTVAYAGGDYWLSDTATSGLFTTGSVPLLVNAGGNEQIWVYHRNNVTVPTVYDLFLRRIS